MLSVANNAGSWFQVWWHVVGFCLIFLSLAVLVARQLYMKKKGDKFTAKQDLGFKITAFLVMLSACLLSIL